MAAAKPHHRTASEARLATEPPPPRVLKVRSPSTFAELAELHMETPETLVEKHHNASKAQKLWAARPLAERQAILRKFRSLVDENQDQLAKQVTVETGRPIAISNMIMSIVPSRISFWIDRAEAAFAVDKPAALMPGMNLEVHWEPLGVVAHISAWNFPILMGCDFLVPALVCGNAVLYKPSEYSVLSGQLLCKLLYDAGVPPEVCPCLVGDGATGAQILDLPIDAVSFIGSVDTGSKIAAKVGPKMIRMDLEMGGKDGFAVLEDADIDQAVAVLAEAAMENTGQSCNRADRIFVADSIYDKFLEGFVAAIKAMPEGDPLDPNTKIGAITRPQHIAYLEEQVKDAVNKGATVVLGGGRDTSRQGSFFHPTVLTNVDHSMRILTHENFGPIIGVQRLPPKCSDDEVVRLINDTAFGLTGGVFSKNRERAASIMSRLQTGSAYWNVTGLVEPSVPWSGRKCSGFGYTMSSDLRHQNLKPRSLYFPSA